MVALGCMSRLRYRIPIATGCGNSAAGVALRAVPASSGQHQGAPGDPGPILRAVNVQRPANSPTPSLQTPRLRAESAQTCILRP